MDILSKIASSESLDEMDRYRTGFQASRCVSTRRPIQIAGFTVQISVCPVPFSAAVFCGVSSLILFFIRQFGPKMLYIQMSWCIKKYILHIYDLAALSTLISSD
ncbi:hypothetical protein RF11_10764 [Thelohanellus kitauei]|uniref:Uncharacterized protein n=1 Tax=Thelohanellus kitauei TaxID=669202 RepID=A0A0C2J7D1_THEKT|nr:hypothetical protein RF11_12822 [Thelohanellus kitauei]KII65043.1 hypothetical protein RF11_10764 [Thelohanellus kitauei]